MTDILETEKTMAFSSLEIPICQSDLLTLYNLKHISRKKNDRGKMELLIKHGCMWYMYITAYNT